VTSPLGVGVGGVVVVTDRRRAEAGGRRLVDVVAAALAGGARHVLLRDKDLPAPDRRRLAGDLRDVTAAARAALVVGGDVDLALEAGADGVHLAAADPWPDLDTADGLEPPGPGHRLWIGRSCHTVGELVAAEDAAHWVTYSPVFPTASKPGYGPALGLDGLAAGCRAVPDLPVIALGGVTPGRARQCVDAGAAGVALMGAVMGADDPGAVVRAVIDELKGALA
jgi:thiamine-phosphate pyrophosphorylase